MAKNVKRIGVLTGGGDAPGLNAVIRAVVKSATNEGIECVGLEDSFDGLIYPERSRVLTPRDVTGILRLGGTMLGTTNRGNPFAYPVTTAEGTADYSDRCVENFHKMGLDALVVIGGDGTLAIAYEFFRRGLPVVGVPKTIDNDLGLNYPGEPDEWVRPADGAGPAVRAAAGRDSLRLEDIVNYATPGFATAVFVVVQMVEHHLQVDKVQLK